MSSWNRRRKTSDGLSEEDTYLSYLEWHWDQKTVDHSDVASSRTLEAFSPKPVLGQRIYRALDNEIEEIRLVVILPAIDPSSPIACRLIHTSLGRPRQYETLSYVWGEPIFAQEITLDGQPYHITSNLESALRQLRKSDEDRVLWIDALCIDQTNLDERRVQIGHMKNTYSHCLRDLIWLGPEDKSIVGGLHILKKLEGFNLAEIESMAWQRTKYENKKGGISETWWSPSQKDWSLLKNVLKHLPIWKRVWIVQEISSAPNVLLVCGSTTLDWAVIEGLLEGGTHNTDAFHSPFSHDGSKLTNLFETAQIIKTQRQISRSLTEGGESSLLDVLSRFRFTSATDKKDKVFALLGLVSDDLGIPVDYSQSVVDIYTDTTRRLIHASRNLDIICQSQWETFGNTERTIGLPSWVPDFSAPGRGRFLFAQRSIFQAGPLECPVPSETSGTKISVSGVLLGRLDQLPGHEDFRDINTKPEMTWDQKPRFQIFEWACSFGYPLSSATDLYRTGESKFRAFSRTISADCTAFPMKRMTEQEIDEAEAVLERCCHDVENGPHLSELISYRMFSELRGHWRFGITDTDLFAMVPVGSQKGDVVAIVHGGKVPFVLRPVGEDASQIQYQFVGGAYVHGCMDGEAMSFDGDLFPKQIFVLV
jgi:hypothetical protein